MASDENNAENASEDIERDYEELDAEVEPLPEPEPDPVERILGEIEVAPDELTPELRAVYASGYESARRALLGRAVTADERNVLSWACAWTAYRRSFRPAWSEGAEALRGAADADGTPKARTRAARTLDRLTRAARLQGIEP